MDIDRSLRRMGKGWFILRKAWELGLIIDKPVYGEESAMNTREREYEKTKAFHNDMLRYLFDNWSKRIKVDAEWSNGTQTGITGNEMLYKLLIQILKKLNLL